MIAENVQLQYDERFYRQEVLGEYLDMSSAWCIHPMVRPLAPACGSSVEVEHGTSTYSGIVRMMDLSAGSFGQALDSLFGVAPDKREAFRRDATFPILFLPE